jgi:hypothetical protein
MQTFSIAFIRQVLRKIAKRIPFFLEVLETRRNSKRRKLEFSKWLEDGRPVPPPHAYKESTVREYARIFKANILVETGTYTGEMIENVRKSFKTIISVEIDSKLYEAAKERFRKHLNITILLGDSGKLLPSILDSLSRNTVIFWLDGHYSGGITGKGDVDTPIRQELRNILESKVDFVLLVDDARFFTGHGDYPSLDEIGQMVKVKHPEKLFTVQDDIIRIHNPLKQLK